MTRAPSVERVLREYLSDDDGAAPDYVLDVVADRIGRQPQRRSWPFPGRTTMTTQLKLIAGLAAVVVLAVVGYNLLLRQPTGPGASPTATPVARALGDGPLAAGWYRTFPFGAPLASISLTFQVPDGWTGFEDWAVLGPSGTDAPDGIGVAFLAPDRVFRDPCHWDPAGTGQWPRVGNFFIAGGGTSPEPPSRRLAASLKYLYNGGITVRSVSLGGRIGLGMDYPLPAELDLSTCDKVAGQDQGAYFVFGSSDPKGTGLSAQGPGQIWHLWLLDIGETPIAIIVDDYPGTPQADRDAAQAIVDSIVISP